MYKTLSDIIANQVEGQAISQNPIVNEGDGHHDSEGILVQEQGLHGTMDVLDNRRTQEQVTHGTKVVGEEI